MCGFSHALEGLETLGINELGSNRGVGGDCCNSCHWCRLFWVWKEGVWKGGGGVGDGVVDEDCAGQHFAHHLKKKDSEDTKEKRRYDTKGTNSPIPAMIFPSLLWSLTSYHFYALNSQINFQESWDLLAHVVVLLLSPLRMPFLLVLLRMEGFLYEPILLNRRKKWYHNNTKKKERERKYLMINNIFNIRYQKPFQQ